MPAGTLLEVVQRIRYGSVDPHLEMEVVAEAQTGAADGSDHLTLAHVLTDADADRRLMPVARRQRGRVLDARVVPVAAGPAGDHETAGIGRADRGACGHADVDARVARLPGAALAERRGDRAIDRPDHRAGTAADRACGRTLLRRAQLRGHLRLHLRKVTL